MRLERSRVQFPAVSLSGRYLTAKRPEIELNLGQVVHTHVRLSRSSIIWYQSWGSDVLQLGR